MNEYTATLLHKQRLLAEEILNCKHTFRAPTTQKASAVEAAQSDGKASVRLPQLPRADSAAGMPNPLLFRGASKHPVLDGAFVQNDDGAGQDVLMQFVQQREATRQPVDIPADAVSMRAISRYFQRDARRFREE